MRQTLKTQYAVLTAKGLSPEKGVVSLEFEFEGFEEYEKNLKSNEDKSY